MATLLIILFILWFISSFAEDKPTEPRKRPKPKYQPDLTVAPKRSDYAEIISEEWKTPTTYKSYASYLSSTTWLELRALILKRDGFKCCSCGSSYELQVHHITYKDIYNEKPEQLVTLCKTCHTKLHEIAGKGATYYPLSLLTGDTSLEAF